MACSTDNHSYFWPDSPSIAACGMEERIYGRPTNPQDEPICPHCNAHTRQRILWTTRTIHGMQCPHCKLYYRLKNTLPDADPDD
eukprot:g35278.t1